MERAVAAGEPAHVAKYAFQLAQAFNNFYHQYPIIHEENREKKVFLLWMTDFFRRPTRTDRGHPGDSHPGVYVGARACAVPLHDCDRLGTNKLWSNPMRLRTLGIVLAGGKGTRLYPLTKERAKPAVPFGGKYRIIDFVLSNFINSGIYSIYVLTQFRSQSLLQHLSEGWQFGGLLKTQFIIPVPAQMRSPDETWYQGTADAIYQNINLVEQSDPHVVAIFGGDHIYRMNIASMIEFHVQRSAEVTVAAIPVAKQLAAEFGVIETAADGHIIAFHEKNPDAPTIPGDPERVYASMGNYVFSTRTLLRLLHDDAADETSSHDFGRDILPKLAGKAEIFAYDFQTNRIPGEPADAAAYWRDVGTIDAYYEANMDLRSVNPALNLYNREWPLRTTSYPDPPAKFTFDEENRRGQAIDSIVSGGCHAFGRRGAEFGAGPRRARACRRPGGRLRHSRQLRYRPPREDPPRHPRQERARAGRRHHRLRSRRATASPITSRRAASWWSPAIAARSRSPAWWCERYGTTRPRLDRAVRLPGHLRSAGVRHRRAAGAR